MKYRSICLGLLIMAVAPADAGLTTPGLADGIVALEAGRYSEAFNALLPLAETGQANAQFALSEMYRKGLGLPRNLRIADEWLERAASSGHIIAQRTIGLQWLALASDTAAGRTSPAEQRADALQRARLWLGKASEAGDAEASWQLSLLSVEKGSQWTALLEKSARAGHPRAAFELGESLLQGTTGQRDPVRARRWILLAAQADWSEAQYRLSHLMSAGIGGPRTPVDAMQWMIRAGQSGNLAALDDLAEACWRGLGLRVDRSSAWALRVRADQIAERTKPQGRDLARSAHMFKQLSPTEAASGQMLLERWAEDSTLMGEHLRRLARGD